MNEDMRTGVNKGQKWGLRQIAGGLALSFAFCAAGCSSPADKLYAQGEKALAAGDSVKAMIAFSHARDMRPDQFRYHAAVWRAGARFLAESIDRVTVENQEESRFELEQLLADEPNNATYLVAMAHVLERSGDKIEAAKKLDAAVKADPKSVVAHLARAAFVQRNTNNVDEAIGEYQQVIALEPNNLAAHLGLGRMYVVKKDAAKELDEFTKAQAIDPESYVANESLGDAFLHASQSASSDDDRQKKLVNAFRYYSKAATVQVNNPEPHWGLGMINSQAGKWAQAEQELRMAMKGKRYPEMDFQLGLAIARQNRCAEAMPMFQLFLREEPDHPAALYELGSCAGQLGRKDDAAAYYKKLLSLPLPPDGDPHRAEAEQRNKAVQAKMAQLNAPAQ